MSQPLVFLMGRSPVLLPADRQYTRNHYWALAADGGLRFGLSAYAVRLLGEIRHVRWSLEAGAAVAAGQVIGYLEASKATSDLYAPMDGQVRQFNPQVVSQPRLMNTDLYDAGWLVVIEGGGPALLSAQAYLEHLETAWPLAQRLLKGQMGH